MLTHLTTLDGPEPTIANLALVSSAAVVAKIESISAGRFNTADGSRPAEGATLATSVVRTIGLQVTDVLTGTVQTGSLEVAAHGGTIGCETWELTGQPPLEVGAEVVLFLDDVLDVTGKPIDMPAILQAMPVSAGDVVVTPVEGEMPLATLTVLSAGAD